MRPSMLKETWLTDLTQHAEHEIFIMDADTLAFLHVNHAARINLNTATVNSSS